MPLSHFNNITLSFTEIFHILQTFFKVIRNSFLVCGTRLNYILKRYPFPNIDSILSHLFMTFLQFLLLQHYLQIYVITTLLFIAISINVTSRFKKSSTASVLYVRKALSLSHIQQKLQQTT